MGLFFWPYLKNLPEPKFEEFETNFVGWDFKTAYINSARWLLIIMLMQIYSKKEQARWKEIKNVHFEEKKEPQEIQC